MPSERQDYLGTECELGGLTIPDFQEAFCVRCTQPSCTRSQTGKSNFDQRVQNWYPRLFDAPKLDMQDPRYSVITAKRFLTLDVGNPATPGTSIWFDPRDGGEAPKSAVSPVPSTPTMVAPSPPATSAPTPPSSGLNTPFQGGVMIGQAPTPKPTVDPWAVPEKPREPVVTPGSKVKLGGGSGV